jgi:multicomponent K+:H+ antiporter subunit A
VSPPDPPPREATAVGSFLLARVARFLFPVTLVFSVYLLLRGHDEPGGGFSAGLVTSLALVIQAFAFGVGWTRARLGRVLEIGLWVGLALALLTGALPLAFDEPFLTHHHLDLRLGAWHLPLSTTLVFDTGVYAAVVGTTATALATVAEEDPS